MATYSTDLTTITDAASGTWVELSGTILGFTLSGGGGPGLEEENFIQGLACYSQTTGKAQDAEISIAFDNGSGVTFAADEVVFGWCYYAIGANLKTTANSGWMFVICSSLTAGDYFVIGGSDSGRNPYGGWTNVAIDPTATESGTLGGGGNGGTYRYFGQVCNTIGEVTKGNPSAVDAIRRGRGIISITGTGGSFSELGSYNDYNAGGTPPGTSSTSIDSGRHRLGLFQTGAGTYLWKGLLSLGTTGTSVTFTDSNETIIIDDCPHTYASFNKIEINNASSSVTWNNITIISTASTTNGIGYFEMIANATVNLNGCSFNDMGTFIFQSNGTIDSCNFNSCELITSGGATITGCNINSSTSSASMLSGAADMANITGNRFVSDGSNHAVEINAVGAGSFTWDNELTGYVSGGAGGSPVTPTSTGNEAIYLNFTSAADFTINVADGATTPSIRVGAGFTGDVNVVAGQKSFKFTVNPSITGYEWRIYSVTALGSLAGAVEITGQESASADNQTYSYSYSTDQPIAVQVISQPDEDYEEEVLYFTLVNSNQDVTINLTPDNNN